MRKHKYHPDLVSAILKDKEYYVFFFNILSAKKRDVLFTPKRRANGDLTMKCPLHNEKTPSFRVYNDTRIFKCFGCGESGNFLNLLSFYHQISFLESIKIALEIKPVIRKIQNLNQLKFDFPEEEDDLPF